MNKLNEMLAIILSFGFGLLLGWGIRYNQSFTIEFMEAIEDE